MNSDNTVTRLRYLSDIHIEFLNETQAQTMGNRIQPSNDLPENCVEVLILAGDIGNPYISTYYDFLENMNSKFNKIFIATGNHEYYAHGHNVEETNAHITSLCDRLPNVKFLNNEMVFYAGHYYIGSTQWGYLGDTDTEKYKINDTVHIKDLTPKRFDELYQVNREFLASALESVETLNKQTQSDYKAVVITHHLPCYSLTIAKYQIPYWYNYNGWFSGHLDDLLIKHDNKMKHWIYGHTHDGSTQHVYWSDNEKNNVITLNTPITKHTAPLTQSACEYLCNPVGYVSVVNYDEFDFNKYVVLRN